MDSDTQQPEVTVTEQPASKPRARKPFNRPPKEFALPHKAGTRKAALIEALKVGATFEECQQVTGWTDYKQLYESIHCVNAVLGYGLEESEDGKIKITTPPGGVRPFRGGEACEATS